MFQTKHAWIKSFSIFLALTFLAAAFGSLFQPGAWYAGLDKAVLNPPNFVFAPVWTILYLLMPISATWVYMRARTRYEAELARNIFLGQLLLNALWSFLFFGLESPVLALIDLVCLWFAVVTMIYFFARISLKAALLQVPYLLWLSFAGYLNIAIWWLN